MSCLRGLQASQGARVWGRAVVRHLLPGRLLAVGVSLSAELWDLGLALGSLRLQKVGVFTSPHQLSSAAIVMTERDISFFKYRWP